MIGVLIAAAGTAVNVWCYATTHHPINLAAAIFCGLVALACAVNQ